MKTNMNEPHWHEKTYIGADMYVKYEGGNVILSRHGETLAFDLDVAMAFVSWFIQLQKELAGNS